MKVDSVRPNYSNSFKGKREIVKIIPQPVQASLASKITDDIFYGSPRNLKYKKIDNLYGELRDAAGNLYLKIKKYTEFGTDSAEVKRSKQAVKCFNRVITDANDNLIKHIKTFHNAEGPYKVEVWDADGKTLINEVLGSGYYRKQIGPSRKNSSQTYLKSVYNRPLKKGNPFEVVYYYKNKEFPAEKYVYDCSHKLVRIERGKYRQNGSVSEIQIMSPKRKLINTIKLDPNRDYSGLFKVNNSRDWPVLASNSV